MEGHKRFAPIGLKLAGDLAVQLFQLSGESSSVAPVSIRAAGIGLDQAIADGCHLLHRPQRVQPDVGINRAVIMALIIAVMSMPIAVLRRLQGGDAAAGVDHLELGVFGGSNEFA